MARNVYTFSKTRMLIHVLALLITAGVWMFIAVPWELYRAFGKK